MLGVAAFATASAASSATALRGVSIIRNPADSVAGSKASAWAAGELEKALTQAGIPVQNCGAISEVKPGNLRVLAAGIKDPLAAKLLASASAKVSEAPESLALVQANFQGSNVLLACGADTRGLVFALLDLADRVRNSSSFASALAIAQPIVESPANRVRSMTRLFTSDVEDKPWYNDRQMWPEYLTMLATNRFNRFNLALGIGYDFIRNVTDAYFLFPYPFLLQVPGFPVRVPQLPDAERDQNLKMLQFIAEETVGRGMEFQLGLWMHGYEWIDSPKPNYTIEGLTKETHGPYCREAVKALLKLCPAISGVTFRIHGESGVEEGSYNFWKTVFDGVADCGRKVEIDMHAKGMDETMMKMAVATRQPVKISPKYWAEHFGMPYHQADIRELERPNANRTATGLMKFSAGSRSFLRYGYGDLLREDRAWGVVHRIWPGTQRLLLWADPVTAAAHSRAFSFCGSDGVEIMEPLSFKGRRGSGIAGDRCAYADQSLRPRWDWEKYAYSHRVWGHLLYNPNADPESWRRYLNKQFGPGAPAIENALANASRILPTVTTAHGASAGNNTYWPEVYLNQSIVDPDHPGPYRDTPTPRVFGNVSPLDPQLFSRINDYADQLLQGECSGKYSPVEAAQWIEDYATQAASSLAEAESLALHKSAPEYRRIAADLRLQIGLGRFFGAKFRSGALYRIYEKTGDLSSLEESLKAYRSARAAWLELATAAKAIYMPDITVGEHPQLRGHWLDRLPAIDADIALMASQLNRSRDKPVSSEAALSAIKAILGRPTRRQLSIQHQPAALFRRGQPVPLRLTVEQPASTTTARLYYRHVTQAERYLSAEMHLVDQVFTATIPAEYTLSPYPLEYYFEVKQGSRAAWLYPGFNSQQTNQPYFVVRST